MSITTSGPRRSRRSDRPFNPGRRHRADFARQATIDAFGWHFARALDQSTFVDRAPGTDYDKLAVEVERDYDNYLAWCKERDGGSV